MPEQSAEYKRGLVRGKVDKPRLAHGMPPRDVSNETADFQAGYADGLAE
jgi:hypothetical protein